MKTNLPIQIQHFVDASNKGDPSLVINDFAQDAKVLDEGETLTGQESISNWMRTTQSKYNFHTSPIEVNQKGDEIVMKAEVSGNFPGSPVVLSYSFGMREDKIVNLQIK